VLCVYMCVWVLCVYMCVWVLCVYMCVWVCDYMYTLYYVMQ